MHSLSEGSDTMIEVQPSPKLQDRKSRKKRRSHKKTTNKANLPNEMKTDRVWLGNYRYFYEEYNIDKVCR